MEVIGKNINKNLLMHRDELELIIKFQKTPSRVELKELLAKNYNVDKDLIVIKKIFTEFGSKEARVKAFIYENKEWLNKFEILKKKDLEKQQEKQQGENKVEEATKTNPENKEKNE